MNIFKYSLIAIFSIALAACSSDDSPNGIIPKPPGDEPVQKADAEPVTYPIALETLETNQDFAEPVAFTLPKQALDGQQVTVQFNFNSKSHNKMKLMMTKYSSSCSGSAPEAKQILVKYSPDRVVVVEDVNVVSDYQVEPNTDYAIEIVGSPSNCSRYEVGLSVWLGNNLQDPERVRICTSVSESSTSTYYHLLSQGIVTALSSFDSLILGQNVLCGKEVDASEKQWKISESSFSGYQASGLFKGNDGIEYSFLLEYDEQDENGYLTCSEDGTVVSETELQDCADKVMDKTQFEF